MLMQKVRRDSCQKASNTKKFSKSFCSFSGLFRNHCGRPVRGRRCVAMIDVQAILKCAQRSIELNLHALQMRTTHCCINICVNKVKTRLRDCSNNNATSPCANNGSCARVPLRSKSCVLQGGRNKRERCCKHNFFENMLRNLTQRVQIPQVYVTRC